MFERFTARARQVIVTAQEEARWLGHGHVGSEHILLGLLRGEDGVESRVLDALGVTLEQVRSEVVRIAGPGGTVGSSQIPLTPGAKTVLERSLREALSMGHRYIGPEHFLLAIAGEITSVAARILLDQDANGERIREEVIGALSTQGHLRGDEVAWLGRHQPRRTIEPGSFDGLDQLLDWLSLEVPRELGRIPDLGDVLIALACARDTLTGQVLSQLGIDPDGLCLQVDHVRLETLRAHEALAQQVRDVERAKQRATEAMDFERAAELRAEERQLLQREHERSVAGPDALRAIRRYLGIPETSDMARRPPRDDSAGAS